MLCTIHLHLHSYVTSRRVTTYSNQLALQFMYLYRLEYVVYVVSYYGRTRNEKKIRFTPERYTSLTVITENKIIIILIYKN